MNPKKLKLEYYGGRNSPDVIVTPYTFAGGQANSEARLNALSLASGRLVVAMHAPGTGRVTVDRATRRQLQTEEGLAELAAEHAAVVKEQVTSKFERSLGMGDSGRAVWVAAMQNSSEAPFTHVLTRDGVNTYAPEPVRAGAARILKMGGNRGETGEPTAPEQPATAWQKARLAACGLTEMAVYGRLMCETDVTTEQLLALAATPDLPYCNVTVEHGISGSPGYMTIFNACLHGARQQATGDMTSPRLLTLHQDTWGHNNLMDPDKAALQIEQTFML